MKKETVKWAVQILLSILSAIATALGATSCMGVH
ncbi:MAG: smalltalk protein [Bacteroidales bacterium]|nr:smalltalk protein [Candidatus Minthousia equi]